MAARKQAGSMIDAGRSTTAAQPILNFVAVRGLREAS